MYRAMIISQQLIPSVVKYVFTLNYVPKIHNYTEHTERNRPKSNFCLLTVTHVVERKQLYFRVKHVGVILHAHL